MELPGLVFLALTLCLPLWFLRRYRSANALLMFAISFLHIAIVFLQDWQLNAPGITADSHVYYFGLGDYLWQPLAPGTVLVTKVTFGLRTLLDLSFTDMMLMFGLIGTCPILMLAAQVGERVPKGHKLWPYAMCLLPGMFFWTSLIGKDVITTAAIALIVICARDLPRRSIGLASGFFILMLIRPHIALLLICSFGASRLLFGTKMSKRIGLLLLSLPMAALAVTVTASLIGADILSPSDFFNITEEKEQYISTTHDHGIVFISNPAERVIYFLWRPMFFDADDIFSLIASFENLFILLIFMRIAFFWRRYGLPDRQNAVFYILSIVGMMLFLGLTGYNLGLAMRQKIMFYPSLACLVILFEAHIARSQKGGQHGPSPSHQWHAPSVPSSRGALS